MGSNATSHVVYGYYLGGHEAGWQLKGVDEYGEYGGMPEGLTWFDYGENNFIDQAKDRLTQVMGGLDLSEEVPWQTPNSADYDAWLRKKWAAEAKVPVKFVMGGSPDYADWSLVAWDDSGDWGVPVYLDLAALEERRIVEEWDARLAEALTALGVVPKQENPDWFVFADYG